MPVQRTFALLQGYSSVPSQQHCIKLLWPTLKQIQIQFFSHKILLPRFATQRPNCISCRPLHTQEVWIQMRAYGPTHLHRHHHLKK